MFKLKNFWLSGGRLFWAGMFLLLAVRFMECTEIKPAGFFRIDYCNDGQLSTLTISQMRLGLKGNITEKYQFQTSLELTSTSGPNNLMLYDAYLNMDWKYFFLRAGQYKYRLGLEQSTADDNLELINKAAVVLNLISPTRDIGLEVAKKFSLPFSPELYLSVINGEGANKIDVNQAKTFVGRFLFAPLKDIQLGISFYDGSVSSPTAVNKDRLGAELKYEKYPLLVKGEYLTGQDDSRRSYGYYGTCGYNLTKEILALARYDVFDPDTAKSADTAERWTFGLNYLLDKDIVLQADYENKQQSTTTDGLLTTQIQVKF